MTGCDNPPHRRANPGAPPPAPGSETTKEPVMLAKILPTNEHPVERVVRVVIGLAVLSLVFWGPETMWGLLGAVPLATGLLGSCPLYTLLGLSTCPMRRQTSTTAT